MKEPKISVVIPSFNKANFIYETIDSIVNQTYKNYELIIQDGGSTDDTVKIIKSFAKKYPKQIKWVSKKDKGQLDAINKGLNKAKGDILTYINADDVYELDAFEKIKQSYIANPKSLWFAGRSKLINGQSKEIAPLVNAYKDTLLKLNNYTLLLIVNYLMQPSVFVTRKAYEKYGPFTGNNKFIVEYDMWLKLGKVQMPTVIDSSISKFRFEPGTISATQSKYLLDSDFEVVNMYTTNKLVIAMHKIHNTLRLGISSLLK